MSYETKTLLRDADGVPIPQYWDVETGEFKPMGKPSFDGDIHLDSSPENPVNTEDQALLSELEEVKTELESVRNKLNEQEYEDGAALTKLTGSNVVEEVVLIDAVAATTGEIISPRVLNLRRYVDFDILVSTTLNAGVRIGFMIREGGSNVAYRIALEDGEFDRYDSYASPRTFHVVPELQEGSIFNALLSEIPTIKKTATKNPFKEMRSIGLISMTTHVIGEATEGSITIKLLGRLR